VKDNNPNGHSSSARTPDKGPYVSENAEQCKVMSVTAQQDATIYSLLYVYL